MSNNTSRMSATVPSLPSSHRYLVVMANDSIQRVSAPGSRLQSVSSNLRYFLLQDMAAKLGPMTGHEDTVGGKFDQSAARRYSLLILNLLIRF